MSFDAWYYNSADGTEHGLHDYLAFLNTRIANPDIHSFYARRTQPASR